MRGWNEEAWGMPKGLEKGMKVSFFFRIFVEKVWRSFTDLGRVWRILHFCVLQWRNCSCSACLQACQSKLDTDTLPLVILSFSHFNEYGRKVTLGNRRKQFAESCAHLRLSAAWLMRMVVVWKGWFYASPHNVVILSYRVIPVYSIMTGIRHLLYLKILVFMILARTAWTDSSLGLKPIQRCLLLWTFE